uniref:Bone morphogenetic protein 10 n=1 Tax=Oncorhynchus mykiss TaxID=8022 RepID=A0A8K9WSI1_ONCMY
MRIKGVRSRIKAVYLGSKPHTERGTHRERNTESATEHRPSHGSAPRFNTTFITRILFPLLFLLLLMWPLSGQGSPISLAPERHHPAPGLRDSHRGVIDPSLLEQDNDVDMQSLLVNLRGQFLRTFNLSGLGPPAQPPGSARVEPPEYMMELYNRFANDSTAMPTANIIRSFKNEVPRHTHHGQTKLVHPHRQRHPLLFNVPFPQHERITAAELRLYTLVQTDHNLYAGVDRGRELVELASRQVYGTDNGWEAFDLTAAVQRWCKSEYGTTHRLEVHIASLEEGRRTFREDMEIDTSPQEKHKPLMIVFSNDQSGDHCDDKQELNEMIRHETSEAQDEEALIQMPSNLIYTSRIRRNAKGNQCMKQSLYVEFDDIGWDSWILAPAGYEAFECSGVCTYPLTENVTPTKHAIVQTLVSMKSPQRVVRACCVPTKLDPISLLYLDDTGVVTYKYKFEGMVVAECGCR